MDHTCCGADTGSWFDAQSCLTITGVIASTTFISVAFGAALPLPTGISFLAIIAWHSFLTRFGDQFLMDLGGPRGISTWTWEVSERD